eukprot:1159831-Pelagomonas_calceolata.AAC.11
MQSGKPFLGVCLGLQLLFEGSEESGGCEGLGMIPGQVCEFDKATLGLPVPHIGWNDMSQKGPSPLLSGVGDKRVYFVHSYRWVAWCGCLRPAVPELPCQVEGSDAAVACVPEYSCARAANNAAPAGCAPLSYRAVPEPRNADWVLATTNYGDPFVAAVGKGNVYATQLHKVCFVPATIQLSILPTLELPKQAFKHRVTLNARLRAVAQKLLCSSSCLTIYLACAGAAQASTQNKVSPKLKLGMHMQLIVS